MSSAQVSFHITNGQIIAPNGQPFIAKGINIRWDQLNAAVGNGTNMPLTADFPGINMVRVNYEDAGWQDPSSIEAAVAALTAKGIVVEIEDHTGISAMPYTGTQLAAEQAWYSTLATAFKNNPYVWFGTFNEPGNGTNLAGIAAQEVATYNTIRATGNTSPILMEEPSGGNPGLVGVNASGYDGAGPMPASDYSNMTNIIWDLHYYGWVSNYSTIQSTVSADLTGSASGASGIAGAQTITSADGKVPVIIGEFGNSTTGGAIDANGNQVVQAVTQSGYGYLAWGWDPDEQGDQLTTDSGQMTTFGQQIAAAIGSIPATPPTTVTTPPATSTGNELTTSSGGTLLDTAGNKWTLTSAGVVDENGAAVAGGSGTSALAIVSNVVYGQDGSNGSWYTYAPASQTWSASTAPVLTPPPPPTTPPPTPPPVSQTTGQEITPTSGGTLTDAAGNKWTMTSAGVIDENGSAIPGGSGTSAFAIVANVMYGQDATTKSWYTYSTATQTWASSAAPVLTPTPTPSANDSVVKTGSTAAITDASNNKWTITPAGQVAVNGAADTSTTHVAELAYVNGEVWQENASGMWWGKTSPTASWSPTAGTTTSPLPSSVTIAASQTSATVAWNHVSIGATSGTHAVFISGTGDTVNLSGGTNTISDTGSGNTYVIPAAGKGYDVFTTNVLTTGDTLDLRTALAATNWKGSASTLAAYLSVTNGSQGTVLSIATTAGGTATAIAMIDGASGTTLSSLLAHAVT